MNNNHNNENKKYQMVNNRQPMPKIPTMNKLHLHLGTGLIVYKNLYFIFMAVHKDVYEDARKISR